RGSCRRGRGSSSRGTAQRTDRCVGVSQLRRAPPRHVRAAAVPAAGVAAADGLTPVVAPATVPALTLFGEGVMNAGGASRDADGSGGGVGCYTGHRSAPCSGLASCSGGSLLGRRWRFAAPRRLSLWSSRSDGLLGF